MEKQWVKVGVTGLLLTSVVAGCSSNDEAENTNRYTNEGNPIGYYTNEFDGTFRESENDGPMKELYDHTVGEEGQDYRRTRRQTLQIRDENGNPPNGTQPLSNYDSLFLKDGQYSTGDANYHGHLDDQTSRPRSSYYNTYEGNLSESISEIVGNMDNVTDVRSVIYDRDIVVAVVLKNERDKKKTLQDIERAIEPYAKNQEVTVVANKGTFSRLRNVDNSLRHGESRQTFEEDIQELLRSLGNDND
ncbi:YhcN/YlaJ family sporulation lipoprotein [Bacillus fonticola]|uniref:YhcN/YlaJ family sporulation lipoprotein n=1 Tax=Bacillus fonticola TaxID=2728853 RepID=UPI0014753F7B|nr:YhcN/YlaJ family sporulation lipoprotein [Bacillus fonticola]